MGASNQKGLCQVGSSAGKLENPLSNFLRRVGAAKASSQVPRQLDEPIKVEVTASKTSTFDWAAYRLDFEDSCLSSKLGAGAFGTVYLLQHPAGDFALKVTYLPSQTQVLQAEQEVRALRALQGPCIIDFVTAVIRDGWGLMQFELCSQGRADKN